MNSVAESVAAVAIVAGAIVALVAAVGIVRFADARTAMHAATKPATLGVLLCGVGTILMADDLSTVTKVVVVVLLQLVTAPVGAHMLSRAITAHDDSSETDTDTGTD